MKHSATEHEIKKSPHQAVFVVGSGNSGCKRILRILDFSPVTHCRNDVDLPSGSPLRSVLESISQYAINHADALQLDQQWDYAVEWCSKHRGSSDIRPIPPKDYDVHILRLLGLYRLLDSPKLHCLIRAPSCRAGDIEWLVRNRNSQFKHSLPVLKINQAPAIAKWLISNRPKCKLVHVVRHPAGFLHSWERRVLARLDPISVRRDNINRLKEIAELNPEIGNRFGDIESLTAVEAELYFWLYETETIYEAGQKTAQYRRILDEQLYTSPKELAQQLYTFCGLSWGHVVDSMLKQKSGEWRNKYSPWRDLVSVSQVEFIEKLLDNSTIRAWWQENDYVSRHDYQLG